MASSDIPEYISIYDGMSMEEAIKEYSDRCDFVFNGLQNLSKMVGSHERDLAVLKFGNAMYLLETFKEYFHSKYLTREDPLSKFDISHLQCFVNTVYDGRISGDIGYMKYLLFEKIFGITKVNFGYHGKSNSVQILYNYGMHIHNPTKRTSLIDSSSFPYIKWLETYYLKYSAKYRPGYPDINEKHFSMASGIWNDMLVEMRAYVDPGTYDPGTFTESRSKSPPEENVEQKMKEVEKRLAEARKCEKNAHKMLDIASSLYAKVRQITSMPKCKSNIT